MLVTWRRPITSVESDRSVSDEPPLKLNKARRARSMTPKYFKCARSERKALHWISPRGPAEWPMRTTVRMRKDAPVSRVVQRTA